MLPVRTVHIQLNLQLLHQITAILFQNTELLPEVLAEFIGGYSIVDMFCQLFRSACFKYIYPVDLSLR
jgi:hypothetical protein